jgi:hypothetical protein
MITVSNIHNLWKLVNKNFRKLNLTRAVGLIPGSHF